MEYLRNIKKNYEKIEEICIRQEEIELCTKERIDKFTNLKRLEICPWDVYGRISFPEAFVKKDLEYLKIALVNVEEYKHFNLKSLDAEILDSEFEEVMNNFKEIEELRLTIAGDVTIDESILELKELKVLKIAFKKSGTINFKIKDLSKLEKLKILILEKINDGYVSKIWCSCKNLKRLFLRKFEKFTGFPKEIENLTDLEQLYIHSFKETVMPESFSLLKNLKVFSSFSCEYEDLDPLSKLNNLTNIIITYGKIKTIPDFSELNNLKEFTLAETKDLKDINGLRGVDSLKCVKIPDTKVSDLSPLKSAKQLETLNVRTSKIDKNKLKLLKNLLELECFESLEEMFSDKINKVDWKERTRSKFMEELAIEEEKEKGKKVLKALKKLKKGELKKFEKACLSIVNLKEAFADEIEEGKKRDLIPIFDNLLKEYIQDLKEETLIHLINISFVAKNLTDNYELTIIVLEEALRRKSVAVQDAMSIAFIKAQKGYSPGHREWESTVYDTLIDDIFEKFEEKPLATMLLGTDEQLLRTQDGDELGMKFYDYFKKATDRDIADKVLKRYKVYIFEEILSFYDEDELNEFYEELKKKEISSLIKDEMNELMKSIEIFVSYANDMNAENFEEFLKELKKEENISILDCFDWGEMIIKSEADFTKLDYDLIQDLFLKSLEFDSEDNEAKEVFFSLMYIIDKEKAEFDIVKAVKDSKLISNINFGYDFEVSDDELEMFKVLVIGLINGISKEEIIKKEEEKILLEKKETEDLVRERELLIERLEEGKILLKDITDQFEAVKKDNKELDKFIEMSVELVNRNQKIQMLPLKMADYSSQLIIAYLQNGKIENAAKVFDNYVDKLFPKLVFIVQVYDVASMGLTLGLASGNESINKKVFEKLLGENFEIEEVNHGVLLFNLSCYYAMKKDKEFLLKATKQAIKSGMDYNLFLNDNDFNEYHKDEDFLEALEK